MGGINPKSVGSVYYRGYERGWKNVLDVVLKRTSWTVRRLWSRNGIMKELCLLEMIKSRMWPWV